MLTPPRPRAGLGPRSDMRTARKDTCHPTWGHHLPALMPPSTGSGLPHVLGDIHSAKASLTLHGLPLSTCPSPHVDAGLASSPRHPAWSLTFTAGSPGPWAPSSPMSPKARSGTLQLSPPRGSAILLCPPQGLRTEPARGAGQGPQALVVLRCPLPRHLEGSLRRDSVRRPCPRCPLPALSALTCTVTRLSFCT